MASGVGSPAWTAETIPPALAALGKTLRAATGAPVTAVGIRGNEAHLSGYHRSRRWLVEQGKTDDYSVRYGPDKGGDENWCCALDFTPPTAALMVAMCKRLDAAIRANLLPNVREFYGNADGDAVVDGFDNLLDRVVTSDSSHLWHFHISFYRSLANEDHSDLAKIILGQEVAPVALTSSEYNQIVKGDITPDNALFYWLRRIAEGVNPQTGTPEGVGLPQIAARLDALSILDADVIADRVVDRLYARFLAATRE